MSTVITITATEQHLMDSFILRALAAGCGVALVAGPLGCFVVWRRMAYFGDTLSHAGLMGVALGLMLGIDPAIGIVATGLLVGLLLLALQRQQRLATDTLLGILSHAALSIGLIAVSFMDKVRIDLMGYLFGDILSVTGMDLAWIYGGGAVVLVLLAVIWKPLIALTVHEDMAVAEDVPRLPVLLTYIVLMALTVAIAMKIVGILLVTALLVIPAATARRFARTPETMAGATMVLGIGAVGGGLFASTTWDTPSGPSIVAAATALFALILALSAVRRSQI